MVTGKRRGEVVYGITSLSEDQASPRCLASLVREHWCIENRSHWRRDVRYQEDACRARMGKSAINLAALRNLAISLLNLVKPYRFSHLANAVAANLSAALAVVGMGPPMTLDY
jgi:hypothetical protein